jgi:hypothetical protein
MVPPGTDGYSVSAAGIHHGTDVQLATVGDQTGVAGLHRIVSPTVKKQTAV